MNKKTMKFLKISFVAVIIICILVFVALIHFMTSKTDDAITDVSNIYMSEMNKQIQQKFSSILQLRQLQLKGVYDRTPPNTSIPRENIVRELKVSAGVRGFASLDMLDGSGRLESIYGNMLSVVDMDDVLGDLNQNGNFVAQGYNESGESMLLFGMSADYRMEKGGKSVALMAGIPMKELNTLLVLKPDESGMYFHVIDSEGNFIIRNADVSYDSYFEHLLSETEHGDADGSERVADELKEKLANREDYSALVMCFGEEKYIYSSPISTTGQVDWYLIAIMPRGELSRSISELDASRLGMTIISILLIVLSLLVMFVAYYKMTR